MVGRIFQSATVFAVCISSISTHAQKTNHNGFHIPVFLDSQKFTKYWTRDTSVKSYYYALKSKHDYAINESSFDIANSGHLKPFDIKDSTFTKLINKFTGYRWKNIVKDSRHPYNRNIILTMYFIPFHNYVRMNVVVLDKFNMKRHILKYRCIIIVECIYEIGQNCVHLCKFVWQDYSDALFLLSYTNKHSKLNKAP